MKMKHKLFLASLMLLFCTFLSAETYNGTCGAQGDNLTWTLDTETGVLTISGTGEMYDYKGVSYRRPWISYSSFIKSVIINDGVTSIGWYTFSYCYRLTSVTIPNSVTSIGERSFYGCSSLTSVTIPNSVTSIGSSAFSNVLNIVYNGTATGSPWGAKCVNGFVDGYLVYSDASKTNLLGCLTAVEGEVTIPNSVTSIGSYAFSGCTGLTSITIPNSVTSIGNSAFSYCSGLTSVTIPNSVTSIGSGAFYNVQNIAYSGIATGSPWGAKSVNGFVDGYLVYSDASKTNLLGCSTPIKGEVTIPNSVTSIGSSAFDNCSSLTSVTIPNSVTSIGWHAFSNVLNIVYNGTATGSPWGAKCVNGFVDGYLVYSDASKTNLLGCLTAVEGEVTIPNSVTSIGEDAFYDCRSLTSITIPNSVTSIGNYAFSGCSGLKEVHISDLAAWCKISFWAVYDQNPLFYAHNLYLNGSLITDLVIPNSVTSIGSGAFYGCSSLTSVTIPNSVTSIGSYAFDGCSGLTAVHISDLAAWCKISFAYLGNPLLYAHNLYLNGELVTDLVIPNSVTSIGDYAFSGCSGLTSITIPNSVTSIGRYAFEGCSGLTSIIIPNSITTIEFGTFDGCIGLTSVTIPNSVTSIDNEAFQGCSGLTAVHISDLEAWYNIFFAWDYPNPLEYAHNLYLNGELVTDLVIPNSVTRIKQNSFIGCSITSVTIPNSVTSIGNGAFKGCMDLQQIYIYTETPPSISSSTFENIHSDAVVYVQVGSLSAYQAAAYWKDMNIKEMVFYDTSSETHPTSVSITVRQYIWEMNNQQIVSCGIEGGEVFYGNTLEYIGLEPESEYEGIPIVLTSNKGATSSLNISFTTSALTLKTQQSQPVSANTAILLAETNMSDAETSCGFEWKRNDAPADMPATQVLCPVANGLMAGRLKGLKDDVYYKYRAFYKSAAGNMYYGDWQYIFTGDVTVEFDPILYTYAAQFVTERTATVKGYALAGSEDFNEQGFEYWAESRTANAPTRRAPQYEIGEKHTVKASGISMRVTLNDLDEGTTYKYRTYAKVGSKTLYGTEMTFTTQGTYEEPVVTGIEDIDDADGDVRAPSATKVFENGQIYILLPDGRRYNLQGMEVQ